MDLLYRHGVRVIVRMSSSLILINLGENFYPRCLSAPLDFWTFFCANFRLITPLCNNFSFHILSEKLHKGWIMVSILIGIKFDDSWSKSRELSITLYFIILHSKKLLLPLGLKDIDGCKFWLLQAPITKAHTCIYLSTFRSSQHIPLSESIILYPNPLVSL